MSVSGEKKHLPTNYRHFFERAFVFLSIFATNLNS